MRRIKLVFIVGFIFPLVSTMNAQNSSPVNMSCDGMSQRFLDSIGQLSQEISFSAKMTNSIPVALPNYFAVRSGGTTHGGKKDILMGKLFAVSDSGIFLYRPSTTNISYIPYPKIDYIMKGRPLRKRIVGHWGAAVVGWTASIAALSWNDYYIGGAASLAIGATLGFVAGGVEALFWTTVYGLRKMNSSILFTINGDAKMGLKFREQLRENSPKVWKKVDAINFPSGQY